MRIACFQFGPQLGDVDNHITRADAVLSQADPENLDLMVLPELAFSRCNFQSLDDISPFSELTAAGIAQLWAKVKALKYGCMATVGYPEKVDALGESVAPEHYNFAIAVNEEGL